MIELIWLLGCYKFTWSLPQPSDCLERVVPEMIRYVSSRPLNSDHSLWSLLYGMKEDLKSFDLFQEDAPSTAHLVSVLSLTPLPSLSSLLLSEKDMVEWC